MFKSHTFEFEVDDVLSGGADDLARSFLTLWQKTKGEVTSDIEPLSSHLILCDGSPVDGDVPDILSCGPNALSSRVFGPNWFSDPSRAKLLLNQEYRLACGRSYIKAVREFVPVFDMVKANMAVGGTPHMIAYQRLILPFTTPAGFRFLLCYSANLNHDLQIEYPEPTAQRHDDRILKNISQCIPKSLGL